MPTRYLKPGICDSDTLDRCSPMAECLFYRLLVNVDDYGRLDARPAIIKSKCFPLKDSITNKTANDLLAELSEFGLINLYSTNGYAYLQMQKWDNVPRSKESKYPAFVGDCDNLYADVCTAHTVLPVTVTVTETITETVNRKPEQKPETETVTLRKKRIDQKSDDSALQAACKNTWGFYSDAYAIRYAIDPVRNAKVNGQVKLFVGRLGGTDAPFVAAHYLTSNLAYYVQRGHSFDSLLADAEKLRTEWATGRSMTNTRAQQIDKTQANMGVVAEAMQILKDREHAKNN